MEFTIKPLSTENLDDLSILFRQVYGKSVPRGFFADKFNTAHIMPGYFGYFAYHGPNPVAFYGAIPVMMCCNGRTEIAAQSVNTMTHPGYRGKGLFPELAELTYALLEKSGVRFVWGFPNQNSERVFLERLDWASTGKMSGYRLEILPLPMEKATAKIPGLGWMHRKWIDAVFFPFKTDEIITPFAEDQDIWVCRNAAYYHYKSFSGNFTIRLGQSYLWVDTSNGLQVGDIQSASEENFRESLTLLRSICRKAGISRIVVQVSPGTVLDRWMSSLESLRFDSWRVCYRNLNSEFVLDNLKLTLGDTDIF